MSEPPPLDYRNPRDEWTGSWRAWHAIVGFVLTCGVIVGGVFLAVASAWGRGSIVLWLFGAVGLPLLLLAIYVAVRTGSQPGRGGWAIGIWLGMGVAGLIEGLCFTGHLF